MGILVELSIFATSIDGGSGRIDTYSTEFVPLWANLMLLTYSWLNTTGTEAEVHITPGTPIAGDEQKFVAHISPCPSDIPFWYLSALEGLLIAARDKSVNRPARSVKFTKTYSNHPDAFVSMVEYTRVLPLVTVDRALFHKP